MGSIKLQNIKTLLELNGGGRANRTNIINVVEAIKHLVPNFDPDRFDPSDLDGIVDDIMSRIIPIYDKHFTNGEIVGIIEFYQSEAGKAYLRKMGAVTQESMEIGNKFGDVVFNKLVELFKTHENE